MGMIIVSHYQRFYDLIAPTHAHVIVDGKIVAEGDETLVKKIDEEGYEWLHVQIKEQPSNQPVRFTLGVCGANPRGLKDAE